VVAVLGVGCALMSGLLMVDHGNGRSDPLEVVAEAVVASPAADRPTGAARDLTAASRQVRSGPSADAGRTVGQPGADDRADLPTVAPTAAPALLMAAQAASSSEDPATAVVTLTNVYRAAAGCEPLTVDPRLTSAAVAHSADMARRGYFGHDTPEGVTPFDRITGGGYQFSIAAENIAAGQRTPKDVLVAWMNSPGHRANILDCELTQIGVGYATGGSYGTYWTQSFGTPLA
jgi:uncharacterized protein YkwD